jgi:hypothetical protein
MEKDTLIKDITVEWDSGIARGFNSKEEAERFIERICKKTAPHLNYSIYNYLVLSVTSRLGGKGGNPYE